MPDSVLILEDEPLIAWDIEEELTGRGWQVAATVSTLAAAADFLDGNRPDLALLDVNLGTGTSYDLARRCCAEGIAVIFLTGESAENRPEDLRDVPVCSKPVIYDILARTATATLATVRRRASD